MADARFAAIGQEIGGNMANNMAKNMGQQFSKSALRTEGGSFLFCIPIQVGPASPYARNVRHWMHAILVLQAAVCLMRFIWLMDILGGFWMVLLCGLGWYAWHQDMNITYICMWGLGCVVNGLFDTLGLILPLIFDVLQLQFLEILLRSLIPVSEFLGAAFSWHLYVDYYRHGGGADPQNPMSTWIEKMPDPMGRVVDEVDPEEATSLIRGIKKGTKNFDAQHALDGVQQGMQQGSKALAGGFQAGSAALQGAALQGQGSAKNAGQTQQWMQGLGDKSPFASLGGGSPFSGGSQGQGQGQGKKLNLKAPCC